MTVYDLKSLDLPSLSGSGIKMFASLLENPAGAALLLGRLKRDGGIDALHTRQLDEVPTYYPIGPIPAGASGEGANGSADELPGAEARTADARPVPFETAADFAAAYRAGSTSPEDVAERILAAIEQSEKSSLPLRAFIAIDRSDVMAQAKASAERIKAGKPLSRLDGVPVAVKDEFDQTPYPTTVGTRFLGRAPAAADSTVAARLRAAGALLLGKANMYEIGINPEGFNLHHGTARNPYNLDHDPGGSSSGPAAAVAAGFAPISIGADGGGSIRVPAAHCGLVGLKATFGRISDFGAAPLCWSVAHAGPLTTNVADMALAYAAVAGPDKKDATTLGQPAPSADGWDNSDLSGLTLGVFWPWFNHAAEEVVTACRAMLDHLVSRGAALKEIEIPGLDAMRAAHATTILSEMAASMRNVGARPADFSPPVRISLTLGGSFTSHDYVQAQRIRTQAMRTFARLYDEVDVIMTPAAAVTAPRVPANGLANGWSNLSVVTEVMRYVFPGNLTGLPAITFPAGYDSGGMPIGMQAMGRWWDEQTLLRVAYAAELGMEKRLPANHFAILR